MEYQVDQEEVELDLVLQEVQEMLLPEEQETHLLLVHLKVKTVEMEVMMALLIQLEEAAVEQLLQEHLHPQLEVQTLMLKQDQEELAQQIQYQAHL